MTESILSWLLKSVWERDWKLSWLLMVLPMQQSLQKSSKVESRKQGDSWKMASTEWAGKYSCLPHTHILSSASHLKSFIKPRKYDYRVLYPAVVNWLKPMQIEVRSTGACDWHLKWSSLRASAFSLWNLGLAPCRQCQNKRISELLHAGWTENLLPTNPIRTMLEKVDIELVFPLNNKVIHDDNFVQTHWSR